MPVGGELLVVGFEGQTAPTELVQRISTGRVGGVVLFRRNLGTLAEVARLVSSLHEAVPAGDPPLLVSLDQEGGRVQRIKAPLPHWPPMSRLGELDDEMRSEAVGRAMGAELSALGFNVDYAPVLDVHTNPANPIIGDRAFGTSPEHAARHALAFWRGLESAGVRGCGKHFPGHGDTATDSHLDLPRVDVPMERLQSVELLPFRLAVAAGVPILMTAHVIYPAVDSLPATMSRRWLHDILRVEMGFGGIIMSDDLDMKAVADHFAIEDVVVRSLGAGADCFLACQDPRIQSVAEEALDRAAATDAAVAARLSESAARLRAFRATLKKPVAEAWRSLPVAAHAELHASLL